MMDANTVYALISVTITIVFLSFILGANITKMQMARKVIKLKGKIKKLKSKLENQ